MSTNESTTPQALLERAADLLDERGWHQGDYIGPDGCLCALGAIYTAVCGQVPDLDDPLRGYGNTMVTTAESRAAAELPPGWPSLSLWNDEPGRTKTEVQALLRRAAAGESR